MDMKCNATNCGCNNFDYIPNVDIKCLCKHSYKDHNAVTRKCQKCLNCMGFVTSWSCKCGSRYLQHNTKASLIKNNALSTTFE